MPKVSIIVPVYNVEKYIRKCLDSLVNQTLKDIEIIIINDGTKDKSALICEEYAQIDNRIKVIHKENGGLGNARNVGMTYANGEYIGFVDSDDWVDLDYYEKLYNKAIEENADVCVGGIKVFKNNSYKIKLQPDNFETLFATQGFAWLKIYKRDFVEKYRIQFTEKLYYEDMFFAMMVYLYMSKCAIANETFYYYRQQAQSIVHTCINSSKLFDIFKVFNLLINELKFNKNERYFIYRNVIEVHLIRVLAGFIYKINNQNRMNFLKQSRELIKTIVLKDNNYATLEVKFYKKMILNINNYCVYKIMFGLIWFLNSLCSNIKKRLDA